MSKKATKNSKEFRPYSVGDQVLGKVRGYPPWPGIVVDPAGVSEAVLNEQPPGKNSNFHCVLFYPKGDYAWLHPKDLSTLKSHEIDAFLADEGKKRNGDLREGYRVAREPEEWQANHERLKAERAQQELEAQETVDQLESDDADADSGDAAPPKKSKPSKKRKRDTEEELPVKEKKKTTKPKKDGADPPKKATAKSKKNGAKSKAVVESEDEGDNAEAQGEDEDAGPRKKESPPPTKKAKRDKEDEGDDSKLSNDPQALVVRDWRHRLQKTFLSNKTLPKAEAMPDIDSLFATVESYNDMTIEQLQFSKIGKVMRHVAALSEEKIPRDAEYNFRTRAKGLVDKWHEILNANKPAGGSPSAETNGHAITKENEDAMTQGAKDLDLNGKDDDAPVDSVEAGDTSVLADVTMSEA